MTRARVGRALLVALAIGCSLAIPSYAVGAASTGCPTADPCIVVHLPGGDEQVVTGADVSNWAGAAAGTPSGVTQQQYEQRISPGGPVGDGPLVNQGLSVNELLQQLGIDPSTVFTEMSRPLNGDPDGSLTYLTSGELGAPSTFDAQQLPAFYLDGSNQIFYVRPVRGDNDVNAPDNAIETTDGGPIDLYVYTGSRLQVTASPTGAQVKVGQPVTFTASATPDADSASFTWTFGDDGSSESGAQVTHSFAAAGYYQVLVSATAPQDSFGAADPPLNITVGSASQPSPTPSPTPGGGHSGPPSSPQPGPTDGHGTQPTGTPTPTASVGIGAPDGSAQPSPSASPFAFGNARLPRSDLIESPLTGSPPLVASGELPIVTGRLLSDGGAVLTPAGTAAVEAGVAPAGRLAGGWRGAGTIGAVAAIMLLFAAGAARELRWRKRSTSRTGA